MLKNKTKHFESVPVVAYPERNPPQPTPVSEINKAIMAAANSAQKMAEAATTHDELLGVIELLEKLDDLRGRNANVCTIELCR